MKTHTSIERAKKIAEVWPNSTSLADAMRKAGISTNTERAMRQHKSNTQSILGIKLEPHNPKYKTNDVECPSNLDIKAAKKYKSFLITSATNNSTLNQKFFDTLELFSKHHKSQLLIIPLKYRHNTLIAKKDYQWPVAIHNYALLDDLILSKSFMVSGLRLTATAIDPLSGMQAHSGQRSVVYGATSLHLRLAATPGDELPKMLQTTGSCTSKTYTRTKAGGKAKFNHVFAATYVKLVGDKFYHTQIIWDGKGFYFLNEYWTPDGLQPGENSAAIVRGDDHAAMHDRVILKARARLCDRLKPEIHVFHDVFDGVSISHHHKLLDKIKVFNMRMNSLAWELKHTAAHIVQTGGKENWIVDSNHDRHIERYLNEGRHLKEPHNAAIGSELLAEIAYKNKSALECAFQKYIPGCYKFVNANKRANIKGIDVSQHGDRGANGSRGSIKGFANAMYKTVIGHSHSPGISGGAWQTGVSTLKQPYRVGLSTWACADVIINANGKRSMYFYINGKSLADVI